MTDVYAEKAAAGVVIHALAENGHDALCGVETLGTEDWIDRHTTTAFAEKATCPDCKPKPKPRPIKMRKRKLHLANTEFGAKPVTWCGRPLAKVETVDDREKIGFENGCESCMNMYDFGVLTT